MSIHVHLERFEGPLGLLLHLIREQEMDIFNINIHHITRQYLEYIKSMRRLDLEVAGEFVAMAATLLHIKSKMLLPQYNEEGEAIQEDPRKELVQKLLEYKKFKELSAELYRLPLLGRDVFTRGEPEDFESLEEGEVVLEENPLFSLIASYRTAIKNMKKTVHKVGSELQSIASRIMEMSHLFTVGKRILFGDLITETERRSNQVLITFLSLLELAKMGFISVFQNEPFADIHVEPKRPIDSAVVSQVEGYDGVNAANKADELMVEAQLSLTEVEPMFEGEEAPVVQETFADAATDAEIEAEEARLFSGEGVPASDVAPVEDIVANGDLEQVAEGIATNINAEPTANEIAAADSIPVNEAIIADATTEVLPEESAKTAAVEMSEPQLQPQVLAEEKAEPVQIEIPEPQPQTPPEPPFFFQSIQEMPEFIEDTAPVSAEIPAEVELSSVQSDQSQDRSDAVSIESDQSQDRSDAVSIESDQSQDRSDIQDMNVNSAVSQALSAFAAFDEQPEEKREDGEATEPPEVES